MDFGTSTKKFSSTSKPLPPPASSNDLPQGAGVDPSDEVYSADVTYIQSMEFGPSTKKLSSTSKPPPPPASNNALPLHVPSNIGSTEKVSLDSPLSPLTLSVSDNVSVCLK